MDADTSIWVADTVTRLLYIVRGAGRGAFVGFRAWRRATTDFVEYQNWWECRGRENSLYRRRWGIVVTRGDCSGAGPMGVVVTRLRR